MGFCWGPDFFVKFLVLNKLGQIHQYGLAPARNFEQSRGRQMLVVKLCRELYEGPYL